MTISVTPASQPSAAPISVSADAAKLFADAVQATKSELAAVESALKGDAAAAVQKTESAASAWLKAHEPFAVGVLLAALILAIRFHVL